MKSKLFWFGVAMTAAYIGVMLWFFGWRLGRLLGHDLNEVGDFLAGVFSPLAFMWLVLGFIQQGEELKISSKALVDQSEQLKISSQALVMQSKELKISSRAMVQQAEELSRSVAQQTIMAEAATKQIEAQTALLELERLGHESRFSAVFKFNRQSLVMGPVVKIKLSVTNLGGAADDIFMVFNPPLLKDSPYGIEYLGSDNAKTIMLEYFNPESDVNGICTVTYIGLDGVERSCVYSYSILVGSPSLTFSRVRT